MKRLVSFALALMAMTATTASAQNTPASQMEMLDRGLIVVSSDAKHFLSWRMLGTDDEDNTRFDILRNGTVIAKDLYATSYEATSTNANAEYQVVTKVNGEVTETSAVVKPWAKQYLTLQLDQPATGKQGGTYSPNDCSVGDVDGDGQYEIFLKWDPSTSKDNSQGGKTDNVYIDCYKVAYTTPTTQQSTAQLLWRIDLGVNIRAGAHYTQFMVYDFDGDGKAEMICKTAPGSKDGSGQYVSQVATDNSIISGANDTKDFRNSDGRITGGQEYLTVFNGETGKAIHTIFYNPNRNMTYGGAADGSVNWGVGGKTDKASYGNRGERYLAAVAYLDGPDANASGIFCRGYYDYAFIWAVDFDGQHLHQRWLSSNKEGSKYEVITYDADGNGTTKTYSNMKPTSGSGSGTMYQNGNHNMSVADVDGDGRDEIVWGSAACDDDGRVLYGTGFGHGDAIHVADHCPDRPGLEVFQIHEGGGYGWDLHDAATGEILHSATGSDDNGRGMAGQFDAKVRGSLFWSSNDGSARSAVTGDVVSSKHGSSNFRIFWDGDVQEELLDGNKLDKWNGNGTTRLITFSDLGPSSTCNSTKNTPNLQADILGDWREEVILHNGSNQLAIYTSTTVSGYRIPTLMHDHTYRMGICWQNTAYNQPPHLGYYLPDVVMPRLIEKEFTVAMGEPFEITAKACYTKTLSLKATILPDGTRKAYGVPEGIERTIDTTNKTITLTGHTDQEGDYKFAIGLSHLSGSSAADTLVVHSVNTAGIQSMQESQSITDDVVYDLQGRPSQQPQKGIYLVRRGRKVVKVLR